jgi:hypothetical protein
MYTMPHGVVGTIKPVLMHLVQRAAAARGNRAQRSG